MRTNILFLSDLHFGIEPEPTSNITDILISRRKTILEKLIEKVQHINKDWYPDIVVISGDIGWKANWKDYKEALIWINKNIISTLGIKQEDIIVAPGNHDIDLNKAKVLKIAENLEEVDEHLNHTTIKSFLDPFAEYINFCRKLNKNKLKVGKKYYKIIGHINKREIDFIILNSSWYFRKGSSNDNLWLGLPHINLIDSNNLPSDRSIRDDRIVISIFHHPPSYFNKEEYVLYKNKVGAIYKISELSDILLTGHMHGMLHEPHLLYSSALHFSGGATYLKDDYRNNFSILQVDTENKTVERIGYECNPKAWDEVPSVRKKYSLKKSNYTRKINERAKQIDSVMNDIAKRIVYLAINESKIAKDALQKNINVHISKKLKGIISELKHFDKSILAGELINLYNQVKDGKDRNAIMLRQNVCYYLSILNIDEGKEFLKRIIDTKREKNSFVKRAIYIGLTYFCNEIDYLYYYFVELEKSPLASSINAGYHQCYYADKLFVEGYIYSDVKSINSITANIRHLKNNERKLSWPLDLYTLRYFLKRQSFKLLLKDQQDYLSDWINSFKKRGKSKLLNKQVRKTENFLSNIDEIDEFQFYRDKYGSYHQFLSFEAKDELNQFYRTHLYVNGKFIPSSAIDKDLKNIKNDIEEDVKKAKDLIKKLKKNVFNPFGKNNLLDLGCGNGALVAEWLKQDMGMSKGVELSLSCKDIFKEASGNIIIRNAHDLDAIIDEIADEENKINVISSIDFLEHIFDVDSLLLKINMLLKRGDKLILYIPIINKDTKLEDLKESKYFHPEHHIHMFTSEGLTNLMLSYGFKLIFKDNSRNENKLLAVYKKTKNLLK